MKNIALLGSTGSIGKSTLEVVSNNPEKLQVISLTGGSNWQLLAEQAREFKPRFVAIASEKHADDLRLALKDLDIKIGAGSSAILEAVMQPGKLVDMGPAVLSTGGSVANTGMALKRLGLPVRLMGKVGRDAFGAAVCDVFRTHDETLVKTMIVDPAVATSYTVVINPPGIDRIFLHCPGANDT
ncbi:MAG TPA: hypothetical protein PLR50_09830, partial [Candidatus Rifleibacterium sp.]|nr:hypothetical protein [Candidatus Rifleibacterium sp.]